MAKESTPSQVTTDALQSLSFGSIIGGPLKVCAEAHVQIIETTDRFIKDVGLNSDKETEEVEY